MTPKEIEELRPTDDAPMVADVRSADLRALCDMALRACDAPEMVKDEERYRWLRVHFEFANDSMKEIWFDSHIKHYSPQQDGVAEELDKAIDDEIAYGIQRSKPPVDAPVPDSTGLIDAAIDGAMQAGRKHG